MGCQCHAESTGFCLRRVGGPCRVSAPVLSAEPAGSMDTQLPFLTWTWASPGRRGRERQAGAQVRLLCGTPFTMIDTWPGLNYVLEVLEA